MSNQDQYGGKGQGGSQDNDDWDSLTDDQKMQRKQQYREQNPDSVSDDDGDYSSQKPGEGPRMDLGDDFDSLSDEQKVQRKQEYAQRDPGRYGSTDDQ